MKKMDDQWFDDIIKQKVGNYEDTEFDPSALAALHHQMASVSDLPPNEAEADELDRFDEAREVIHWYQYQIAVKLMRALSSQSDEMEWPEEGSDDAKDSDGSAKVSLMAIDRSVSAWRLIQMCQPERADSIKPIILNLERLRQKAEKRFPKARDFIRPGFDEVLGDAN